MTLRDREKPLPASRGARQSNAEPIAGYVLSKLLQHERHLALLKLRSRQQIVLSEQQDEVVFAVASGVILVRGAIQLTDRTTRAVQHSALAFPGDIIAPEGIPAFASRTLMATLPAELLRVKTATLTRLMCADPEFAAAYEHNRNHQAARAAIHSAGIADLDGPQRLAAFLVELALEVGKRSAHAIAIALPLSRVEIAQYLALNPDTLSRLMSRLRADGLIERTSRNQIIIKDFRAIAAMTPLSQALIALDRATPSTLE